MPKLITVGNYSVRSDLIGGFGYNETLETTHLFSRDGTFLSIEILGDHRATLHEQVSEALRAESWAGISLPPAWRRR